MPISASALKQNHNRPVVPMARLNDICPVSLKDTDSEEMESNFSESFTIGRSYLVSIASFFGYVKTCIFSAL